jgi:hypothetical protein
VLRGQPVIVSDRLAAAAALARPELEIDEQPAAAVFEALTRM